MGDRMIDGIYRTENCYDKIRMRMKKLIIVCLIVSLTSLVSCFEKDLQQLKHNETIKVTGQLTVTGNAPFETLSLLVGNHTTPLLFLNKKQLDSCKDKIGKI